MGNKLNCCKTCKEDSSLNKMVEYLSRNDNKDMNYEINNEDEIIQNKNDTDSINNISYSLKKEIKKNIERLKQKHNQTKSKLHTPSTNNEKSNSNIIAENNNFFNSQYNQIQKKLGSSRSKNLMKIQEDEISGEIKIELEPQNNPKLQLGVKEFFRNDSNLYTMSDRKPTDTLFSDSFDKKMRDSSPFVDDTNSN